jgi:hypothetical protein
MAFIVESVENPSQKATKETKKCSFSKIDWKPKQTAKILSAGAISFLL